MAEAQKAAEEKQRIMEERIKREKANFAKAKARREKAAADALAASHKEFEEEMEAKKQKEIAA